MQADISILKWFCVAAFLATVASIAVRIQDKYSLLELGNNGFYMRVGRRLLFFGTDHEVFVPWASLADLTFHKGRFQFLVFHLQTDSPEEFGFKSFETKDSGYVMERCAGERSRAFVVVDRFEICPESVLSIIRQEIDRPVGNISEVDAREQLMLQEGERIIGDQWKR
jgi:hypothetical protein